MIKLLHAAVFVVLVLVTLVSAADQEPSNSRRPPSDEQLRAWLQNMVWHHRFSIDEIELATGMEADEITDALRRFNISALTRPDRPQDAPLLVLPYPGGRHPRIGFLDGAVRPQRETKLSIFTPWDPSSYVVADVPEAIWSNLGLTYLAHTHIPTVWDKQNVTLDQLEWQPGADGTLSFERTLPNGIIFGTRVLPRRDSVLMEMWLKNGTEQRLSDLRVQNCVMLRGARGFDQQTNDNKVFRNEYVACKSESGDRWIITAWVPNHRGWANAPCPCLHSDPRFPDCDPGQTKRLRGWLSFYEGKNIENELKRIERTGWKETRLPLHGRFSVRGEISDTQTGQLLPARLYVQDADGTNHLANSVGGSAVHYRKEPNHMPASREVHTTLSAKPFRAELPQGRYTIRIQRGKECLPVSRDLVIQSEDIDLSIQLQRWINMASRGWFSGDTHVHRSVDELPNVMLAEDLNVAFPLTYWVTAAGIAPNRGDKTASSTAGAELIQIDPTHVIHPRNTEYEIFTVGDRRHTLGAVFILGHKNEFILPAPPVKPIAEQARQQNALLDLDKHSWPWSLMLVPVMDVDLFELANNHHWRTEFGFKRWTIDTVPEYMRIERDAEGMTEWGWTDFGFKTYYALLNCGFSLNVTAGTASGVHPVQLGFGRVYVHTGQEFSYDKWFRGLAAGNSFVTTGPMLDVRFNGQLPGTVFHFDDADEVKVRVTGSVFSRHPLKRIEMIVNGKLETTVQPDNAPMPSGGFESLVDIAVHFDASSWLAVRCFERHPENRVRFAHTNPVHVTIDGKPNHPRREEVAFFVRRMEEEIARNKAILSDEAMAEYHEALNAFLELRKRAK